MSLVAGLDALTSTILDAQQAADRVAGAFGTAAKIMQRTDETVGFSRADREAGAILLEAFTRRDQSVGMSRADMAASEIYLRVFSSPGGLSLPGYGFQTAREAQFWRDLFTIAPFVRGRG